MRLGNWGVWSRCCIFFVHVCERVKLSVPCCLSWWYTVRCENVSDIYLPTRFVLIFLWNPVLKRSEVGIGLRSVEGLYPGVYTDWPQCRSITVVFIAQMGVVFCPSLFRCFFQQLFHYRACYGRAYVRQKPRNAHIREIMHCGVIFHQK